MSIENPKHSCVFCNAQLNSKEALREHFREHGNDQVYSRKTVKREKGSRGFVVDDTSLFLCDLCNQTFRSKSLLIVHRTREHPQEAKTKYICPHCGRQFPLKMDWDNHITTEHKEENTRQCRNREGILKFACNICSHQFFNKYALEFHKSTSHNRVLSIYAPVEVPPPSNKIRTNCAGLKHSVYYCHLCGIEYINKFNLRKHLEIHHPETERKDTPSELIKCNFCCALFYSVKAFETHNMSHSSNDYIVQGEYQRLKTVSHTDLDFDFRRVWTSTVDKYVQKAKRPDCRGKRKSTQNENLSSKKFLLKMDDEELSPASDSGSSSDEIQEANILI